MFAISSVLKAPRLKNLPRKDDGSVQLSTATTTTTPSTIESKKKRRNNAIVTPPPSSPSISSSTNDSFVPRRSKRQHSLPIVGDNNTWVELSVTNVKDRKKKTTKSRSLFYSIETQQGWWDEPPTGASNVIYLGEGRGLEVVKKGTSSGRNRRASG